MALYFMGNEEEAVAANERAWEILNQSCEKDPENARTLVDNAHLLPAKGRQIVDRIDHQFVDDPQLIGKWQSVDFVQRIDAFNPDAKSAIEVTDLKEMRIFLKDGKIYGTNLLWTKGVIIDPIQKTSSKYEIKDINGSTYLFYEWKSGDYALRGMKPWLCVLKKVDSSDYTIVEAPRKEDRIDYPFVADPQVLGRWESVDVAIKPEDFNPGTTNYPASDLHLKGLNISENGSISASFKDRANESDTYTWTKGFVLCERNKTASQYIIREIDGSTYMFFQWKGGDYVLRNMEPHYYILKKVD